MLDFPPSADQYPEHDHAHDGQEEVYVPMAGRGEIEIDGETRALEPGVMVRVGPGVNRKLLSGEEGMRVLAIGGVPGKVYEPSELSQLGAPDRWRSPPRGTAPGGSGAASSRRVGERDQSPEVAPDRAPRIPLGLEQSPGRARSGSARAS